MGFVSSFVGVGIAGSSQLSQLSNSSVSWMMNLLTSVLGSIDGSSSGDAGLLPRIRDDEDAFASLAFTVGLTIWPESDVRSFTVSVFLTFQPNWAVVCFVLPASWPWPARDGTVWFFALSAFSTFWPSWDGATFWSLPFVGSFTFSAFLAFRPSWGDAVFPSSESSPSARRNPSKVGLSLWSGRLVWGLVSKSSKIRRSLTQMTSFWSLRCTLWMVWPSYPTNVPFNALEAHFSYFRECSFPCRKTYTVEPCTWRCDTSMVFSWLWTLCGVEFDGRAFAGRLLFM